MEEDKNESAENFMGGVKVVGLYALPFSIGSSCLYLFGYWNTFKVNIFQFAGFNDILGSAVYPLIGIVGVFIFAATFGAMHGPNPDQHMSSRIEEPVMSVFIRARRHSRKIIISYYLFVLALLSVDSGVVRIVLPLLITMPIMIFIIEKNFIRRDKFPYVTIMLILAVLNIPLMAYALGVDNASKVRSGVSFTYVLVEGSERIIPEGRAPEALIRYLGHVGDFDFFLRATISNCHDRQSKG